MKPRVVITHRVHQQTLDYLTAHCEVMSNQTDTSLSEHELMSRLSDADAMMAFMPDKVDENFLQACPKLKVIGAALKGYDNFDVLACQRRGVWFTVVPDLLTVPTAELTIALMTGVMRNIVAADSHVRSGEFQGWKPLFYGMGIAGSTVGIIGMGAIGKATALRLSGWGAHLLYTDRHRLSDVDETSLGISFVDLEQLLKASDVIILALSLNDKTYHLIDLEQLRKMKKGAFVINPCRGSVISEKAVLTMLKSGDLGGYAADVFEMEDWAIKDRPKQLEPELLSHPNTLFTAHIGSAVHKVRLQIELRAAENIVQALGGLSPQDAINDVERHTALC
ncbi:phosphonate dehydrogenase [Methylophaga sp.]|uniref:phosphonate dehydrogenase n=1 Tax=Methylophaga sp. TaxID=2024840 RepID=UPI003F6A2B92